jgi:hypothetical protein
MKNCIFIITFLILQNNIFAERPVIDNKKDTVVYFTIPELGCKNILDYTGIEQGFLSTMVHGYSQEVEYRIIKNCGVTTILTFTSYIDSIVVTRLDTGEKATCNCFNDFWFTVDNIVDSTFFYYLGHMDYLKNPFYVSVREDESNLNIDITYFNDFLDIGLEGHQRTRVRLISALGATLLDTYTTGKKVRVPGNLKGFYICVAEGNKVSARKKMILY